MWLALSDLRFAVRALTRRPVLSAAVVFPIAFALALNAALFSVTDGLLFRPLPFQQSEQLVAFDYARINGQLPEIAYRPELAGERARLKEEVATSPLLTHVSRADSLAASFPAAHESGIAVTGIDAAFFRTLRLVPVHGRDFLPEEEIATALISRQPDVIVAAILDHELWQRAFGADPAILNTVQDVAGRRMRIVGVMPSGIKFPGDTNVWIATNWDTRHTTTYGRLAPGITRHQLESRFSWLEVRSLDDVVRPGGTGRVVVLFLAACLLLLVAWIQVSALVVAGGSGRVQEVGVRLALGAGHARVISSLALENVILVGAACALAGWGVYPLTAVLVEVLPQDLSRGQYLQPDMRTFLFGCASALGGLAILTTLSALFVYGRSPLLLLQGRFGATRVTGERFRIVLLTSQVGATVFLLYLGALTTHSYQKALWFDYGFDSQHVLLFTPPVPGTGVSISPEESEHRIAEKERRVATTLAALERLPGVRGVASFSRVPLVTRGSVASTVQPGESEERFEDIREFNGHRLPSPIPARATVVSDGFVRALGASLTAGHGFDDREHTRTPKGIIVNETLAKQLSPPMKSTGVRLSVIGRTMKTTWHEGPIVGVVRDLVKSKPGEPAVPQFFALPNAPGRGAMSLAIRPDPANVDALPSVQTTLRGIWGELPPRHFLPLRDAWRAGLVPLKSQALLLTLIAACGVPLAASGLLGAMFYFVRSRSREMAVRIALGAQPDSIRQAVVWRGTAIVAGGLLIGIGGGMVAGRLVASQLFGVDAVDPSSVVVVSAFMLGLAWLAALIPARQASAVDPAVLLRQG